MKKIYLVLTSPNTLASSIIRKFSKNELSHVGIAFSKDLKEIYSFSRKYDFSIYPGCANIESLESNIYKKSLKTRAIVIEVEVSDKKYDKAIKKVKRIFKYSNHYDFTNVILNYIYKKFQFDPSGLKFKNKYFCSSFVAEVLIEANVIKKQNILLFRPEDFLVELEEYLIYDGTLEQLINS